MFSRLIEMIRGVIRKVFPAKTIKQVLGQDIAISQAMINKIETWNAMYNGHASWIDNKVSSLMIEQGICTEFANVCLNEMEASVSNEQVDAIFQESIRALNENLQIGLGLGSFCIKPLGGDAVEYITADRFIPLAFNSKDRLTSVVFIQVKRVGESTFYIRLEYHEWKEDKTLRIQNKAYKSSDGNSIGSPIALTDIEEWANLPEDVFYTGVEKPDFGYYRNPIKNTVDNSPCGISVFDTSINLIKMTDTQFARLDWEFESGERAVHVDITALQATPIIGKDGDRTFKMPKLSERLYRALNLSKGNGDDIYQEYSPTFRDSNIISGLNAYLRRIEFNSCLSYGDLSDVN